MPTATVRGPRLVGLDRLRGAALLLMLVHHLTGWFGGDGRSAMPGWAGFAVTDVAAVAFTVALGAAVPMLLASRARRGQTGWRLVGTVMRRYGLLIPIGVALRAVLGFDLETIGVLETLGVCALATAVAVRVASPALPVLAAATLLAAPAAERAARDEGGLVEAVFAGTFPLAAYVGFALLGAAAAPLLGHARERPAALAVAVVGALWTAGLLLLGDPPDRYPGDASFLVPGITGTALLHLLVTSPRLDEAGHLGGLLRQAGAHTFGIFVSHYGVYLALRELGWLHEVGDPAAVAAAVATAVAFAVGAARMPTLPWSPRTGWARPRSVPAPERDRTDRSERDPVQSAR